MKNLLMPQDSEKEIIRSQDAVYDYLVRTNRV